MQVNNAGEKGVRIVHITPFYAPVVGGVEEVVKKVAEYVASRGCEVFVVTYNRLRSGGAGVLPRHEVINGVRVIRVRPDFAWSHGTYSSELPEVVRGLRPDVVHVHVWRHPHVFQIAKLRKVMKFKAVLHGHAPFHGFGQLSPITWVYHKAIDTFGTRFLRSYDRYIALTPHEVRKLNTLGLNYDEAVVIPNGVEEDKKCSNDIARDDKQILYLGRISKSKNLSLLVKAMVHVVKDVKDVKLVLAGPDEGLARRFIEYAKKEGIQVRYMGYVGEDEKHRLYIESFLYTLPSLYEPFGITLLEASLHGIPSVITGEGGQLYVAPPNRASMWARPNPRDYAEAITVLLTDKKLWKVLSQRAREWAQQFTWNKILPKYEELYKELANQ
jgi:glycosyltransferase involved in cell wall biosynthesis